MAENFVGPSGDEVEVPDSFVMDDVEELPQGAEEVRSQVRGGTLEEVARQALAGTWGTGVERRRALAEAGWDPNEVEAEGVRLLNPEK